MRELFNGTKAPELSPIFHSVRVVTLDGNPWFSGTDVRSALGIPQSGHNYQSLSKDEVRVVRKSDPITLVGFRYSRVGRETRGSLVNKQVVVGGLFNRDEPSLNLTSESGLYKLVLNSRKPEALAFQD